MADKKMRSTILILMCLISFASNFCISLLAPFLPEELQEMGYDPNVLAGIIFAVFPAAVMLTAPLCNFIAGKAGRVPLLYIGVAIQTVMSFVFAYAPRVGKNGAGSVATFMVARAFQGFGAGCANTAVLAITADEFASELGKVMGLNEVVIGLGFMTGPLAGSLLYTVGGFELPFEVAGAALIATLPFVVMYHAQAPPRAPEGYKELGDKAEEGDNSMSAVSGDVASLTVKPKSRSLARKVLDVMSWRLLLTCMTLFFGDCVLGSTDPILAVHLQSKLGLDQKQIGLVFTLMNVAYTAFGPIAGIISDRTGNYKTLMVVGAFLSGLSLILVGPLAEPIANAATGLAGGWTPKRVQTFWTLGMIFLLGTGEAFCMVPVLAAMKESVVPVVGREQEETDILVMLFNQFQQGGYMISPLLGGYLSSKFGFVGSSGFFGAVTAGFAILCAFMFGIYGGVHPALRSRGTSDAEAPIAEGEPDRSKPLSIRETQAQAIVNVSSSMRTPLSYSVGTSYYSPRDAAIGSFLSGTDLAGSGRWGVSRTSSRG